MSNLAILGAQWGDEGKGKITDVLSSKYDIVVRFQGGNNAGHTVYWEDKKIVLHVIPSGILNKNCVSVIGHGVVFDPNSFLTEQNNLIENKIPINPNNLKISRNCPVITSYHKLLDIAREQGKNKIGTTGRGIGPTYEDKIGRKSIKLEDLKSLDTIYKKLEALEEKLFLLKNLYKISIPSLEEEAKNLFEAGKKITPHLVDTFSYLKIATLNKKNIMYEGAQGCLLDIDYGTYPYVTSSNTTIGGIYTGAGVFDSKIEILGITKAYTTRVGEGPFPTELLNEQGNEIRETGQEFGATTGRKRRCGWLDIPLLKYAISTSNISSLALTKVDILQKIKDPKVCISYKGIDAWCQDINLNEVKPIYKDLPTEVYALCSFLEHYLNIPVKYISNGPERKDFIELD